MFARVASGILAAQAVVRSRLEHEHGHRLAQQPVDAAARARRGLAAHARVHDAVAEARGVDLLLDERRERLGRDRARGPRSGWCRRTGSRAARRRRRRRGRSSGRRGRGVGPGRAPRHATNAAGDDERHRRERARALSISCRRGARYAIMSILRCEALTRTYPSGGREITVLRDITFELAAGRILAITGPSGSGKSTLLGLLGGPRPPDPRPRGARRPRPRRASARTSARGCGPQTVGFVFQSFHLIPTLTARENVQVPLELRGEDGRARARRAAAAGRPRRPRPPLPRPALGRRAAARRGGARVREPAEAAVRRRADGQPRRRERANVVELLVELNRELGTTLVLVTHEPELAARARAACCGCATGPWSGVQRRRFALSLAWREARGSRRRGLLIVAAIAIGVAALVAINSFTANLRDSVQQEARALLGADVSVSAAGPLEREGRGAGRRARGGDAPRGGAGRARSASARWPTARAGRRRGSRRCWRSTRATRSTARSRPTPAGEWAASTRRAARSSTPRCSRCWAHRRRRDRARRGALRRARDVVNVPGDVGLRSALGPRVYIPRVARRRDPPADPGLAGALRGLPALPVRNRRAGARRPLPSGALRGAPGGAHRLGGPAAADRDAHPLRQLPRPRGARGPAARRPRRRERRPRLHQAPHDDDRRAALPRGELPARVLARVSRPGGLRRPLSAA